MENKQNFNKIKNSILTSSKRYLNYNNISILKHQPFKSKSNISNSNFLNINSLKLKSLRNNKLFYFTAIAISSSLFFCLNNPLSRKFRDIITAPTRKYFGEILLSEDIKGNGLQLVDGLFQQEKTHEAALILLKNVLMDPLFMEESKKFGVDLLIKIMIEQEFKDSAKELILDIFKSKEVRYEGVNILSFILDQEETKDIGAQYFKVVFLRNDILTALSTLFMEAALKTLDNDQTKKSFADFVLDVWGDPNLRWILFKKAFEFKSTQVSLNEKSSMQQLLSSIDPKKNNLTLTNPNSKEKDLKVDEESLDKLKKITNEIKSQRESANCKGKVKDVNKLITQYYLKKYIIKL